MPVVNIDKSTKRIAKRINKGFQGYPQISLRYFGETVNCATEVLVEFIMEEGDQAQEQRFSSKNDVRTDEAIQTTILKVIERTNAKTVIEVEGVTIKE